MYIYCIRTATCTFYSHQWIEVLYGHLNLKAIDISVITLTEIQWHWHDMHTLITFKSKNKYSNV